MKHLDIESRSENVVTFYKFDSNGNEIEIKVPVKSVVIEAEELDTDKVPKDDNKIKPLIIPVKKTNFMDNYLLKQVPLFLMSILRMAVIGFIGRGLGNIVNRGIYKITSRDPGKVKPATVFVGNKKYPDRRTSLIDLDKANEKRPDAFSLGYLLVIPQGNDDKMFKIPFEFIPEIKEGSYTAHYNAQTVLARLGNLQNFSHSELSTPSITAKYYVLYEEDRMSRVPDSWMSIFTLDKIQKIQRMYESLVMPKFPKSEEDSVNNPFTYNRPPFIKVMIGGEGTNLFTYPKGSSVKGDNINSKYKTYLATSVSIDKDLTQPLILGKGGTIIDTFGFTVTLELLEVTQSYMSMYPDYEAYFKSFQKVISEDGFRA